MCVISFHDTLKNLVPARPPCLFLTAQKRLPFQGPANLADILHNNHYISRHRYNYSAEVLLVYLDTGDKWLLVSIAQAFSFFPRNCLARMSLICLGY